MSNIPHSEPEEVALRNGAASSRTLAPTERSASPTYVDEAPPFPFEDEEQQWTMQRLAALFFRRRAIILGVFTAVLLLFVVAAILTPRVYRSSAVLIINSQNNGSSMPDMGPLSDMMVGAKGRSQATEIEILQSKLVVDGALKRLPAPLRGTRLLKLDVKPRGATDVVDIAADSTTPQFSQKFTDALCQAYMTQAQNESIRKFGGTADYVRGQLGSIKTKMDQASNNLQRFKEDTGITDLETETQARVTRLQTLQEDLEKARVEVSAGGAQLQRIAAAAASLPRLEEKPNTYTRRLVVQQLEAKLTSLQTELNEAKQEYTPDSPEVRGIQGQINQTRAQLAREPQFEVTTTGKVVNENRLAFEKEAAELRAKNSANVSRIAALETQVAQARQSLVALPARASRLSKLQTDLMTYQEAYKTLNDRYLNLLINENAPVANARLLTAAEPAFQVRPNLRNSIIGGIFMGMILALVAAIMVDRMDNRIHSEDDVRSATQLPILAFIPKVAHFDAESIVALAAHPSENQHTPLLESYRMLRTSLMFTVLNSPLRCIMLTSSQPHEGKSSVAANLATVLAMNGKSVLLIDADLRRPSVHRLFSLSGEQGFTNVAAGLCTLEEAIQETSIAGLKVLAVGPTPPNPPEMLDSRQGRALFQRARELADFVIIDAPPALMMADAQILATEADGVLLVVSWEEALKDAVSRTNDLLARTGAKMLGVVVNKWDDRQAAYQNYYQKHYKAFDETAKSGKK